MNNNSKFNLSAKKVNKILEKQVEAQGIHNQGLAAFYDLRKKWSKYLVILLYIMVGFQIVLTFLVGWNLLNFTSYQWLLGMIVGENFLQIVGMCYIVVKFLFAIPKTPENLADKA